MAHRYFAIFGAMRTGSNLLERSLDHYEGLSAEGEAFNPHFIGKPKRREHLGVSLAERNADPVGFLNKMVDAAGGDIPGFRIFDNHDMRLMDHALRDPDCAKLILSRDPVDSFISLKIAQETGQWMLMREENRRLAKIKFREDEYSAYLATQKAHYHRIRRTAQAAGQGVMEVAYDDLGDLDVMNGLAAFIGSPEVKPTMPPRIQRQNPVGRADKVENIDEMTAILGGQSTAAPSVVASEPEPRFGVVDELIFARAMPAIYAPIPGAGAGEFKRFLSFAAEESGAETTEVVDKLKPRHLVRNRKRGALLFTFVRHPAMRLMDVYLRRIARRDAGVFSIAQMMIARDYGGPSPDEMEAGGDALIAGFDAFISFTADNLAGRTAAPIDASWTPQSTLMARYAQEAPIDFVGRFDRLEADIAYVAERIGAPSDALAERVAGQAQRLTRDHPPETWLTRAREEKVFRVFERDYARLGYGYLSAR